LLDRSINHSVLNYEIEVFWCSVAYGGGGGDYCDHKYFESDYIHVLVNAVNNNIHCENKNGLIVGNVCDHADKYLSLYYHSENLKIEKEASYQRKNLHMY